MPVIALLNQSGKKVKDLNLNDEIFQIEPNQQVLYDVVNAQRAAMRQGTHDTKTRSEVRGGGRKPWRQKGTGRARQGSIRSPQLVGVGVAFGPTPRSYAVKVNRKVKQLGLKSALSSKVINGQLVAVDTIQFNEIKTKNFVQFLKDINVEGKTMVIVDSLTPEVVFSSSNIPSVFVCPANHVSVYEILCYKNLVITEGAIKYFEEVLA